jgi:mono/diheme cytochrome c family protein
VRLPRQRFLAPLIVLPVLAVGAAGCGRSDAPDLVNGKAKFVQKCASCHALARANASGVQGPNLDHAFGPARRKGFGETTVDGVVREQIALARRNSIMPQNLVRGADRSDVAAYVAAVAGQPGKDQGELASAGAPDVSNKVVNAKDGRLEIDADPSGALSFVAGKANAPAGAITLVMHNPASVGHNIGIQGKNAGPVVGSGGTSEVKESLTPGKYTFLCTVPGHADGGMKGELTVK